MAALDSLREAIFRQARTEGRREPPDAYGADALAEMARRHGEAERGATAAGVTAADEASDGEAAGGARHGASPAGGAGSVGGAGGAASAGGAGGAASAGGAATPRATRRTGPPKIIVRVDLGALLRGWPTEGEVCEIAGFGPVAVSAVRDMIDSGDPS
jgi:hypothetical protein